MQKEATDIICRFCRTVLWLETAMQRSKKSNTVEFTTRTAPRDKAFKKSELPKRRPLSRKLRSLCLHVASQLGTRVVLLVQDPHVSAEEMVWPAQHQEIGSVQKATKAQRQFCPNRSASAILFGKVTHK